MEPDWIRQPLPTLAPQPGDALLVVDVQNDFLPGGALPVPHGADVIAPLNRWIARFTAAGLPVCASRDWHPPDHCSFRPQGGPWPAHCVAGTAGAEFASTLALPGGALIISKGCDPGIEAYSAFAGTALADLLRVRHVRTLFVGGLATDYCVYSTVDDALREGFGVVLLADAVRPVEVHAGDGAAAVRDMRSHGAVLLGQPA